MSSNYPSLTKDGSFFMAGTEGTGAYKPVVKTSLGQVGVRALGDSFRVRVEPANSEAAAVLAPYFPASQWKQPESGGQARFSCVVDGKGKLNEVITSLLDAFVTADWVCVCDNTTPEIRALVEGNSEGLKLVTGETTTPVSSADDHATLVARVKELKLPGANFASKWSLVTLRAKLEAATS
jgi:hypothetical protein